MPKTVDHDAYREELLERCFDLFGRQGFSNVTMRGIASEIGVSTGTLYHYFPTKVAILEQMFAWVVGVETRALGRDGRTDEPLHDRLAAYWLRKLPRYRNLLLLAVDLLRNGPEESEAVFGDFAAQYRAAIARALDGDGRRADVLFTYALGLVVESLLVPGELATPESRAAVREAVHSICAGGDASRGARSAGRRPASAAAVRRGPGAGPRGRIASRREPAEGGPR